MGSFILLVKLSNVMAAGPISSGYDLMRQYHAKAYSLVSEALDLDESGNSKLTFMVW